MSVCKYGIEHAARSCYPCVQDEIAVLKSKIADLSKRKDLTKEDRQSLTAVFGFEAGLGQVEAEFKKRAERAEGLVRKLAAASSPFATKENLFHAVHPKCGCDKCKLRDVLAFVRADLREVISND